jgi:hypothetical protein
MHDMHSVDPVTGRKYDRHLHDPILRDGDHDAVAAVSKRLAKQLLGWSDDDVEKHLG